MNTKTAEQLKNLGASSGSNPVSDSSLTETKDQKSNRYLNLGHADSVNDNGSSNTDSPVISYVSCDIEKESAKNQTSNSLNDKLLTDSVVRESHLQVSSSHSTMDNSESGWLDSADIGKKLFSRLREIKFSENMLKPSYSRISGDNCNIQATAFGEIHKEQRNVETVSCQYESLAGVQLGCQKRRKGKPWRLKEDNSDPETRILDITVFSAHEAWTDYTGNLFFLSAACSDGLIR